MLRKVDQPALNIQLYSILCLALVIALLHLEFAICYILRKWGILEALAEKVLFLTVSLWRTQPCMKMARLIYVFEVEYSVESIARLLVSKID